MTIDGYEITQTKKSVVIFKDGKVVYMKPKRKDYTDKELRAEFKRYKDMVML